MNRSLSGTGHPHESARWQLGASLESKRGGRHAHPSSGALAPKHTHSSTTDWIKPNVNFPESWDILLQGTATLPPRWPPSFWGRANQNIKGGPDWSPGGPSSRVPATWPVFDWMPFGMTDSAIRLSFEWDHPQLFLTSRNPGSEIQRTPFKNSGQVPECQGYPHPNSRRPTLLPMCLLEQLHSSSLVAFFIARSPHYRIAKTSKIGPHGDFGLSARYPARPWLGAIYHISRLRNLLSPETPSATTFDSSK